MGISLGPGSWQEDAAPGRKLLAVGTISGSGSSLPRAVLLGDCRSERD